MLQREQMDDRTYHEICDSPSAFSRHELEQTLAALEKAESNLKVLVGDILKSKPIEKPTLHQGGKEEDYFLVRLAIDDAAEIVEELGGLEAQAVSPEGETTSQASQYASLLDRWFNYFESFRSMYAT